MLVLYIIVILMWDGIMFFLLIERNLYSPVFLYVRVYFCTVTKNLYTDMPLLNWFNLTTVLKQ